MDSNVDIIAKVGEFVKYKYVNNKIIYRTNETKISVRGDTIEIINEYLRPLDQQLKTNFLFSELSEKYSTSDSEAYVEYLINNGFFLPYTIISDTEGETVNITNRGLDINIQDQHTPAIIAKFNNVHASTTITADSTIEEYTIDVASTTGIVVGNYIIIFEPNHLAFYFGMVLGIVSNTLTLDSPLDHAFEIGSFVDIATTNMSVDGSSTPVIFGLRGTGAIPGVSLSLDVTKIIFICHTTNPVSLVEFGDIAALTRGLVLRTRDGIYKNIFNVKTNGEIAQVCSGWTPYQALNPAQGQDGFTATLTFASPGEIGVTLRIPLGEDAEFVVQDAINAGGTITLLEVLMEGHIVED